MPTPFQIKIYGAVKKIPRGRITTYKILADAVGCRSYSAVGQALRKNPYAPDVPCHRVIASSWQIGGFEGQRKGLSIEKKKKMLSAEGVTFINGKLADQNRLFRFGQR